MEQNQPGTAPPGRSYAIPLSLMFFVLAVILGVIPNQPAPHSRIPPVDPAFFDTAPMRKMSTELLTADDSSKCTECHESGESLDDVKPGELGHHEKKLQHGRNNKCFHCHNPKDMSTFQNREGEAVKFEESVEMCTNCHGPQYRDWKAGIHGRRTGYFDAKRGEQKVLRCIECHDPHFPVFKPMKPAPGPHALHGSSHASPEHGKAAVEPTSSGTPKPTATSSKTPDSSKSPEPSLSATPGATTSATPSSTPSATPSDHNKGDKP